MSKPKTWKIISAAKAQANRANAQLSTGPRTEHGKAASSANAIAHGLTSKQAVLRGEDPSVYNAFVREMQTCLKPIGERERAVFDEYVLSLWRLQRCRRTETAVLDECIQTLTEADRNLTPDQALARVFTDAAYQKKMSLFLRYQSAIERAVTRSLKELTALQAERRQAEAETEAAQPPQTIAAGHYPGPAPDLEQPAGFLSQPPQARPTHATA